MLNCPFCGFDLTRTSLNGDRCPSCGAQLVWADDAGDSATPEREVREALPRAPVVEDRSLSLKEILATIVRRGPADAAPGGSGELATGALSSAAPPTDFSPGAPAPSEVSGSESSEGRPAPAAAGSPAPDQHAAPAVMRTIDPRELDPEQAEHLAEVWQPVIAPQLSSRMTLKSDSRRTAISGQLAIPPRSLQRLDATHLESPDYRLLDWIGEGGVGIVYAARQASINRTVAVKMLKPEIADDADHRNKFLIEAVVTGDLDHPNIVPIYELGSDQSNALFYSMKRVQGIPWLDTLRKNSTAQNLDILMKVADAIAFAHSRGVIHRDLKPENVMLGDFGEVLVMDWGIALSTSAFVKADSITQSSSMGGTPAYMAPEMATGPLDAIRVHSDVYLLGAILFEIITGQPPHTGGDVMECLRAAARNDIVATSKSGELLEIAYRAMSTRPEDRYGSVQEFQAAIREYQSHSESIVLSQRAADTLIQARRTQDYQDFARAVFAYQEALAIWEENTPAQAGLIEAKFAYARAAYKKGDYDLGVSLLDAQDPDQARLLREIDAAREERIARQRRLKAARRTVLALAALVFVVVTAGLFAVSHQYRVARKAEAEARASYMAADAALVRETKAKEDEREAKEAAIAAEAAAIAAEGDALAAKGEAEIAKAAAEDASYIAQIGLAAERIASNAFLDALRLLEAYRTPERAHYQKWEWGHLEYLCHLDAMTLKTDARVESVAASPDGRWLVAGTSDGHVHVWDRRSGEMLEPFTHPTPVCAVAISPDGGIVASGGQRSGEIQIWERSQDGRSYQNQPPLVGHPAGASVLSLRFSAEGRRLLSGSADGTARLWDWRQRRELHAFRGHSGSVFAAALHPDGTHAVTGSEDGTVRVWPVPSPASRDSEADASPDVKAQRIRFIGHQGAVYAADFSPDGRWIASAGRDGRLLIWDWQQATSIVGQDASPDGGPEELILTVQGDQVRVFRFDSLEAELKGDPGVATRGQIAVDVGLRVLEGHSAEVRSLAFAERFAERRGTFLVSSGHDNTVKLWDLSSSGGAGSPMRVFRGHGGWVRAAVFLPDDSLIASGGYDRQVKIWDPNKYEEVRVLRGQNSQILDASLSADGGRAITADRDGVAWVWDIANGQRLYDLQETDREVVEDQRGETFVAKLEEGHEFLVSTAVFFPNADPRLLTSAGDSTVRLWNYLTGGQLRTFTPTGTNAAMALSDDGRWLLTGGSGNAACLWDVDHSDQPLATLEGHQHEVTALAISYGGELAERMLLTGDASGIAKLWQYRAAQGRWEAVCELDAHLRGDPITAARFLLGNRQVLTASQDYTVMRWEVPSGRLLIDKTLSHPGGVRAMDVASDGRRAVTVCEDDGESNDQGSGASRYRLSLWDLEKNALIGSHVTTDRMITSIALDRDQQSAVVVAAAPGSVGQVYRWHFASNRFEPLWSDRIRRGAVWSAAVSQQPGYVVTVGGSRAQLWQEEDGRLVQSLSPHGPLNAAAFSPSGRLAVTAGSDGAVKIWNVDEGDRDGRRVVWKIPAAHGQDGSPYAVNSAVFGPRPADGDEYLLTAGDDGSARLWRLDAGPPKLLAKLSGHTAAVRQAVFSRDGLRIATASSDGTVRIWNAADPEQVSMDRVIEAGGTQTLAVTCADFSPDGKRLVVGGEDNTAKIWPLEGDAPTVLLEGHTAGLTSVAFAPDGQRVVSGSRDGMAKVWDASSGNSVLSLNRHAAEVTAARFSATGDRILTASSDETAILWLTLPFGTVEQTASR